MSFVKKVAATLGAAALLATTATAATTNLRIQTHYAPETVSGKLAAQYIEDVQSMSNGEINNHQIAVVLECIACLDD